VNSSDPFGLRVRLLHDPEGKIQRALSALIGGSEIFHQMFKALHLAPPSQANISVVACGLASSPYCSDAFLGQGGGNFTGSIPGNMRIDVNGTFTEEELEEILAHEFVHAAAAARGNVKTGITCEQSEDTQACANRWEETIRQQRQSEDDAKKKKEKNQ
jgi:hypothetical protein